MSLANPIDLVDVVRPRTLAEALVHLSRGDVTPYPLAGGTGLLAGTAAGVRAVLDLSDLGLDFIRGEGDTLHLGAMATLQDVVESEVVRGVAEGVLARAAYLAAPRIQRHQQTVGGTLVGGASDNDFLVAALALDARVVMFRPDKRDTPDIVPLAAFLAEERQRFPYVITELRVPLNEHTRATLVRVARTPRDRAIVTVAVAVDLGDSGVDRARVVVGGVGEHPVRLQAVETLLAGRALDTVNLAEVEAAARAAVAPQDDWRASAAYRRHLVGVLTRRALTNL